MESNTMKQNYKLQTRKLHYESLIFAIEICVYWSVLQFGKTIFLKILTENCLKNLSWKKIA